MPLDAPEMPQEPPSDRNTVFLNMGIHPHTTPCIWGGISDRFAGCVMNATNGLLQFTPESWPKHQVYGDIYSAHRYGTIGDCYGGCGGGCLGHGCARDCTGTLLCYDLTVPALSFVRACLRALSKGKTFIACPSITSFLFFLPFFFFDAFGI